MAPGHEPRLQPAILVEPVIAYRGAVASWAADYRARNPFHTFWYLESGGVRVDWSGGSARVGAGRALIIPAGLARRHRFQRASRLVSLSFRASWESGRPLFEFEAPVRPTLAEGRSLARSARRVADGCPLPPRGAGGLGAASAPARLALHGATELFVADLLDWALGRGLATEPGELPDARLAFVLRELAAAPRAGPLPFAAWRVACGLGRVQLERIARRHLGTSLRVRRDEWLLAAIRRRMSTRTEALKETAAAFGFHDGAHFTRWVTRHAGATPRVWRRHLV